MCIHWRRLVKNIGWANQNIWGKKVVKNDKCMGVSQLLGARARAAPPKSTPMFITRHIYLGVFFSRVQYVQTLKLYALLLFKAENVA